MATSESLPLPHDRAAPGLARRHLTAAADDAGWDADLLDRALLLTSELVTNAVVHGRAPVELTIRDHSSTIRIAVSDGESKLPTVDGSRPDPAVQNGRGIYLVDRIADRWGTTTSEPGPGKSVWFELRHPLG